MPRAAALSVYVQHVDTDGVSLWSDFGADLTGVGADEPQITTDGAGGSIVAWTDGRNEYSDIYAQRISAAGVVQWAANGIAVCDAIGSQGHPVIAEDGSGGCLIAWEDGRDGTDVDIYAQRIDATGSPLWTPGGIAFCDDSESQQSPTIILSGTDGTIVANEPGVESELPRRTSPLSVYPNPFNPRTTIQFTLERPGNVVLNIVDLRGTVVAKLIDGAREQGQHLVPWDGVNLGSGVYWVRLETEDKTIAKRMTLLR